MATQPTKRIARKVMSPREQVDELRKCKSDPIYFMKTYLVVDHPVKGRVPFELFPFQEECIKDFLKYPYTVVNKSRQLGLSTTTSAFCLWMAMFQRGANILLMATKLETSKGMIEKLRIYFNALPKWMTERLGLTDLDAESVKYLKFNNGSKITAIPTAKDAGRGSAVSLFVVDEAALIDNLEELWEGIFPTVSSHPGARFIVFSSPKGKNFFCSLFMNAKTATVRQTSSPSAKFFDGIGPNRFHAIELPWDVHPERDQQWFEEQSASMSRKNVAQEFLCDFGGSADTFVSQNEIEHYRNNCVVPLYQTGPTQHSVDLWVWKEPTPDHEYLICADVATGVGGDFSAFHIIDTKISEVVAEYMGKLPTDDFGDYLVKVARGYNNALIIQELNAVGIGTANKLRESGYENVWYDPKTKEKMFYMTPEQRRAIVPGYMVGTQNRDAILAKVEEVLRNKRLRIYSTRFVNQLETFMWNGKRAESAKRKNDDLVMALAIGLDNFEPNQQESIYTNSIAKENKSWANAFLKSISSRSKTLDQQKYGAHATQNTAAQAARVAGQPNHLGQPDQQQRTPQSLQAGKRNYLTQRAMFPWMFD
jgi:hypothetical protein